MPCTACTSASLSGAAATESSRNSPPAALTTRLQAHPRHTDQAHVSIMTACPYARLKARMVGGGARGVQREQSAHRRARLPLLPQPSPPDAIGACAQGSCPIAEMGRVCVCCVVLCVAVCVLAGRGIHPYACGGRKMLKGPRKVDSLHTTRFFVFWTLCR